MFIYVQSDTDEKRQIMPDDYLCTHAKDVEKIFRRAVNQALLMHKRLGNSIAVWKDGKVVIVPPEEIVLSLEFSDAEE